MRSDELLLASLQAIRSHLSIPVEEIEDITVGTVLTPGAAYQARAACLAAGFPETTPVQIINRFCASGLMAVGTVVNQIRNQEIECGLAIGFESMTTKYVLSFHLILVYLPKKKVSLMLITSLVFLYLAPIMVSLRLMGFVMRS